MKFLSLSNGIPRSFNEATSVAIYDQRLTIVSGAPADSNEKTGPVTTGSSVTLPQSGTYSGLELEIYHSGQRLDYIFDYAYVGAGSGKTQVQFTFDLLVQDVIDFVIQRGP